MSHRLSALALLLLPGLAAAQPPGSLLVVSPDGKRLAAVNADTGVVAIIDLAARKTLHEVYVGKRAEGAVWVGNTPVVAVTLHYGWRVAFIDADGGKELERDVVLEGPVGGIAATRDGKTAYVTHEYLNKVSVIDLAAREVVKQIPAGVFPQGAALSPDERTLYVTEFNGVLAIDLGTDAPVAPKTRPAEPAYPVRPKSLELLAHALTLDGYMLAGFALSALLARVMFWPARPAPGRRLPFAAVAVILAGAVLVPASWPHAVAGWGLLGSLRQADILSMAHYAIVWYVIILQILVYIGWWGGWRWVRGFWLRFMHLLCIVIVAGQALNGYECPVTTWDRDLRGGDLANIEGSWPLARMANRALYTRVPDLTLHAVGYAVFACLVFLSWILVRPEVGPPPEGPADGTPVQVR